MGWPSLTLLFFVVLRTCSHTQAQQHKRKLCVKLSDNPFSAISCGLSSRAQGASSNIVGLTVHPHTHTHTICCEWMEDFTFEKMFCQPNLHGIIWRLFKNHRSTTHQAIGLFSFEILCALLFTSLMLMALLYVKWSVVVRMCDCVCFCGGGEV